jgi:hypothetical protein
MGKSFSKVKPSMIVQLNDSPEEDKSPVRELSKPSFFKAKSDSLAEN